DIFYHPSGLDAYAPLIAHGVLGVEMEAATLYTLAARFGARALTICTMTDCLVTGAEIDAEARQVHSRTWSKSRWKWRRPNGSPPAQRTPHPTASRPPSPLEGRRKFAANAAT